MGFDYFVDKCDNSISNLVDWYNKYVIKGTRIELNKFEKKYLKITKVIGS